MLHCRLHTIVASAALALVCSSLACDGASEGHAYSQEATAAAGHHDTHAAGTTAPAAHDHAGASAPSEEHAHEAPVVADALPAERDGKRLYAVRFDLRARGEPFGCGKPAKLGTADTLVEPTDARMYVHDVELVRADGERVALELYQDGQYQRDNVALIDFADDTGLCFTGHAATNTAAYGYAPVHADYTGVRFKLGVPEEANHLDGALAPAPYNATGMWWSWSGGYKYLRLDLTSEAQPVWYFHGGAAGCSGTTVSGFECAARQIAQVELMGFDANSSVIVFDAAKFYAESDLTKGDSTPGCMGAKGDSECVSLYASLGVNVWDDAAKRPEQTVFSVQAGAPWQPSGAAAARSPHDPLGWPDPSFQRAEALDRSNISKAGESRSHAPGDPRHGASCMRCHQSHGPGIGRFTAAGSVFFSDGSPARDVRVEIFEGTPDRANQTFTDVTRYALLEVDAHGNFFTTEPIPYDEKKLTARILGHDGKPIISMFSTKQTGVCNTCHTAGFRLAIPLASEE